MALERVAMTSLADIPQPDEMGMFGEPGSLGGWSAPSTARSLAMDAPLASRIEYDAEMLANAPLPGGGRGTDELMDVNDQSDRMVPHAMLAGQFERHILTMLLLTHDPDRPDATYEKIREAVLAGADVNLPDDAGVPPLSLACSLGLVEPTRELLDLGADYNSRDRLGNTALHSAAAAGHDEVLGLLIERSGANEPADRGPQVDPQSFTGATPLHLAAAANHGNVVELLCHSGCLLVPADRDGHTPESLARVAGHNAILRVLRQVEFDRDMGFAVPDEKEEVGYIRQEMRDLQVRAVTLRGSSEAKMAEISRLTKLSQQYVQQAQAVADRLLDAETAEEIDGLELESNKYVELAEQCARELAVQRADAAGLRAELARTETDEKRKAAELADAERVSQLGSEGKIAAKSLSNKTTEAKLLLLQVAQLRRELSRHAAQNRDLRGYIGKGYSQWLRKTADDRSEIKAGYESAKSRLVELEAVLPRNVTLIDQYNTKVSKLRGQLADVNTSVAQALNEAAKGDARAAAAEEMTAVAQKEIGVAQKQVRVALGEKRLAELAQTEAEEKRDEAASKTGYLQKQLVQNREKAYRADNRLDWALREIKTLKAKNAGLAGVDGKRVKAEAALLTETQRSETLRIERNDFERQTQEAHTRIRELEANVNTGQTDWWEKKLKSAQKWTARRDRLYGPEGANRRGIVSKGASQQIDAEWEALNHMTQAVDVSLRRTCGQLRLRTTACQTDVTWYRGELPTAAEDSEGERDGWKALVQKKESMRLDEVHQRLRLEKMLKELTIKYERCSESEAKLRAFKKQIGPAFERDKIKVAELQVKVIKLTAMISEPNPVLKSVHSFIADSEKEAAMQRIEEAKLRTERPVTPPPPLKNYSLSFQQTGRPIGIVWEKRERFDQLEIYVEAIESASQAERKGLPADLQLVLRGVKSEAGSPPLAGLRYRDVMNILTHSFQHSPMVLTLEEPPRSHEEAAAAAAGGGEAGVKAAEAAASRPQRTVNLSAIGGASNRQSVLRMLAAANHEKAAPPKPAARISLPGDRSGLDSRGSSGLDSRGSSSGSSRALGLPVPSLPSSRGGESSSMGATGTSMALVSVPDSEGTAMSEVEQRSASRPTTTGTVESVASTAESTAETEAEQGGGDPSAESHVSDSYALTALVTSEAARLREAHRASDLARRIETMGHEQAQMRLQVNDLQTELISVEQAAADSLYEVADGKGKIEARAQLETVAAALLAETHNIGSRLVTDLVTLLKDNQNMQFNQLETDQPIGLEPGGEGEQQPQQANRHALSRPSAEDVRRYGTVLLNMELDAAGAEAEQLPLGSESVEPAGSEHLWLAEAALSATLGSGWELIQDPNLQTNPNQDPDALAFAHPLYGLARTHPTQLLAKSLYHDLLRWAPLAQEVASVYEGCRPTGQPYSLIPSIDGPGGGGAGDDSGSELALEDGSIEDDPGQAAAGAGKVYRALAKGVVRQSFDKGSAKVEGAVLAVGQEITAISSRLNQDGQLRVNYEKGWVSMTSAAGKPLLEEVVVEELVLEEGEVEAFAAEVMLAEAAEAATPAEVAEVAEVAEEVEV